jgi:hypothetical protein
MSTFKHSGDLGDIIFSLPTIRALGGGVLYLDPNGGKDEPLVKGTDQGDRTKLNMGSILSIAPVLKAQPYIEDVRVWEGETVDYNLDKFREHVTASSHNLADSHLDAFRLDKKERDSIWITNIPERKFLGKNKIIARSCRYQGNHAWWAGFCYSERKSGGIPPNIYWLPNHLFLGHKIEHELFEYTFNVRIDYIKTPTLMDAAQIITGADNVFCNQNVLHAIAEGMKKPLVQEVFRLYPATLFHREGAEYV